jgi:C-terminal processing protease CtpA/Prc
VSATFNLDFEEIIDNESLPVGWIKWGNYDITISQAEKKFGENACKITASEEGDFGCVALKIPVKYKGKEITLKGFFKTKNVVGSVGLIMRLDGKSGVLEFDNMQDEAIQGDNDWKQYSISLPFPKEADNIFVGGIIQGSGEAWFDNLEVLIDDKSVQGMPFIVKPKTKAELDTEFSKGSNISLDDLNETALKNLNILGKVWGFVKYHHPEVAKSNFNMDAELFRILPTVQESDFKNQLFQWVNKFGKINEEKAIELPELEIEPTTDWIHDDKFLSPELVTILEKLEKCRKDNINHYLSFAPYVGNPIFENEESYPEMLMDDDGMRVLSLFRFWNMIEYFFPYKYMTDQNWDEALIELIPQMIKAEDGLTYKLAALDMIKKVQDTHANIWMRDKDLAKHIGVNGVPLEIKFIDNKPVITKIYASFHNPDSKIKVGDIITHIDNQAIETVVVEKIKLCTASNEPTMLRNVARRILRTNNSDINLKLVNALGETFNENLKTIPNIEIKYWEERPTESHKILEGNIGYLYPAALKKGEIIDIMSTFKSTKGLIIDLRCYPSDFLVFSLGKYLLPNATDFVKFTSGMLEKPGAFMMGEPLKNGEENPDHYTGKVVIIINEETQSQAEYTTMALRNAPKCTVIGSTTAGADGNVSSIVLPGGIKTMISGIGVYYPDGRETQRIGIIPDIEIKPTVKGIQAGQDELLDRAIIIVLDN